MSDTDLRSRLLSSDGLKALRDEQSVCARFSELGWSTAHGPFYRDRTTRKLREIDVLASQIWVRGRKSGDETVRIKVVAELKSASGFHLVFSPLRRDVARGYMNHFWLGYEGKQHKRLQRALIREGLQFGDSEEALEVLRNHAYPQGNTVLENLMVEPPPLEHCASAFRESSIGNEKDLDNSVMWRAGQALASSLASLRKSAESFHREWITVAIADDIRRASDPMKLVTTSIKQHVRMLDIFHPVVVIDARLWATRGGDLIEIPWCRFVQLSTDGASDWWFDIVHRSKFDEYAEYITGYYSGAFSRARAKKV